MRHTYLVNQYFKRFSIKKEPRISRKSRFSTLHGALTFGTSETFVPVTISRYYLFMYPINFLLLALKKSRRTNQCIRQPFQMISIQSITSKNTLLMRDFVQHGFSYLYARLLLDFSTTNFSKSLDSCSVDGNIFDST